MTLASVIAAANSTMTSLSTSTIATSSPPPQWVIDFHYFRKTLFNAVIEPIIVYLLGPGEVGYIHPSAARTLSSVDETHRRLGFLPNYVEDVKYYRESSMSFSSYCSLLFSLGCVLLVFLSCFYHNQKTSPLFISPRRHRLPKLVPPPLPIDSFFSWVKVIFYISDEEIINRIGYDALIFLRFHRLALRCIVKMSFFSFLVLLPLNFTGGGHANANDYKEYVGKLFFTDFLRFTMANVSGGSPRLWVHCFAAYLLTGIVVRELLVEYNAFNHIRHRYLLSRESHLRTVLVTNIPRHLRAPCKITTYFKHVYPDAVKTVTICQNVLSLEKLVDSRTDVLMQIERELLVLCRNEKKKLVGHGPLDRFCGMLNCAKFGCCNGPQERLTKLYSKLEDLNNAVEAEQKRRKHVMKRLDLMEAGTGSSDIDYILASPFVGDSPDRMRGTNGGGYHTGLPSIGAPRNPDGSIKRRGYEPPAFREEVVKENEESVQWDALQNMEGPQMRHNASPSVAAATPGDNDDQSSDMDHFDTLGDVDQHQRPDKSKKKKRKIVSKAKQAIRRYSQHLTLDNKVFGLPQRNDSAPPANSGGLASGEIKQDHIEDHTNEVCDKAFIVMRTFTASTIAIQSMHSSKPGRMNVSTAPEPRDILWPNIYISKGAKRTRTFIGESCVLILITFYAVPVALVSLLVSDSALISFSSRLAQLDRASAFFSSAIGMVQPMCLVGIQQLLPPLFIQIGKAEGLLAFSEVQMRAFSRYFSFQVCNIFLVTAIAGSVFDTLAIILENPESAFEMLGNSLPRMSSFFVTYVTMKSFLGLGVELVRAVSLVQGSLRYTLFPNSTLRQQRMVRVGCRAIDDPGWFPFHKILAQDMLVVVISVVFAVVAPLVLIPCMVFCLFSRILWTHHHLYVFESVFETGGQFWPKIFRRFVFGLIIAQATITGQFLLKECRQEAIATIFLMFLTYSFLRKTRARYDHASSTLPLEVATVMDISVSQEEELLRKRNEDAEQLRREHLFNETSSKQHVDNDSSKSALSSIPESDDTQMTDVENARLGSIIGRYDPFEHAYVQPVLRASARARPEQPFPPSQLGREEFFAGDKFANGGNNQLDKSATVRLKMFHLQDRELVDRWWSDQLQRSGKQDVLPVLIGEESGTLLIGNRINMI